MIKTVAKISTELAEEIRNTEYESNKLFNPTLDNDGNYIISLLTAQYLDSSEFEIIDFKPVIDEEDLI